MKMIKWTSILVLMCCTCLCCENKGGVITRENTDQPNEILDSIIHLAQQHSYSSDKVDWNELSNEMYMISARYDSLESIGKPVEYMFEALGDYHGMLMYDYKAGYSYRPDNVGIPNDDTYGQIGKIKINEPYTVVGKIINKDIAYIEILGTGVMQDDQIKAARDNIRKVICALKQDQPRGWILDLRCNIGGNMHPMMAGIGELIHNAKLGGDTKDGINLRITWSLKNGNFQENGYAHYPEELLCPNLSTNNRIAVLTSRYTASSGEVVVSSLKGQENIKIIGEKTSGLSSANGWFVLPDKWIFAPMVAYFMSIDGIVHWNGIKPDYEVMAPLNLDQLESGILIDRAIEWITLGK